MICMYFRSCVVYMYIHICVLLLPTVLHWYIVHRSNYLYDLWSMLTFLIYNLAVFINIPIFQLVFELHLFSEFSESVHFLYTLLLLLPSILLHCIESPSYKMCPPDVLDLDQKRIQTFTLRKVIHCNSHSNINSIANLVTSIVKYE